MGRFSLALHTKIGVVSIPVDARPGIDPRPPETVNKLKKTMYTNQAGIKITFNV